MQKPPRRVGKWFRDRHESAPERKELKQDPLGGGGTALALAQRLAAASRAARRGVRFPAGFEAADGDDLIPRPDSDGEGVGSPPQDGVGAFVGLVERWDDAAAAQPDEGGMQQLVWQLSRQLGTGVVPGQGKRRSIQSFLDFLTMS